ncbi:MAG: PaaI family thioesterase [Anaerolineae bacterium]
MSEKAIQEFYDEPEAVCYGCGRLNLHGLQIKSYPEGDETVATFLPESYHTAVPGYVYGGLIASLVDCHATGTAAGAALRAQGGQLAKDAVPRFLTAALHVDYLKPTPIGVPLEVRGKVKEIKGRKVVVEVSVRAEGQETARGEVVTVQAPESLLETN